MSSITANEYNLYKDLYKTNVNYPNSSTTNNTIILPSTYGNYGQSLSTDGTGQTSWIDTTITKSYAHISVNPLNGNTTSNVSTSYVEFVPITNLSISASNDITNGGFSNNPNYSPTQGFRLYYNGTTSKIFDITALYTPRGYSTVSPPIDSQGITIYINTTPITSSESKQYETMGSLLSHTVSQVNPGDYITYYWINQGAASQASYYGSSITIYSI
jgi:hypothetical protein